MPTTPRRLSTLVGIAAVTVALSGGCGDRSEWDARATAKPDAGVDGVSIELDAPKYRPDTKAYPPRWQPRVVNESGAKLDDAVLTITVDKPGRGRPQLELAKLPEDCIGDDPDAPVSEDPECVERQKEKCVFPGGDSEADGGSGRVVECTANLPEGTEDFTLDLTMPDFDIEDAADMPGYPDLTVSAELSVPAGVVTTASDRIEISGTGKYARVDFDGVPAEVPTDRTDPDGFDWSVTVTNDTDAEVRITRLYIEVNRYQFVEIDTEHDGCAIPDYAVESGTRDQVECDEIDLAAGDTHTVDLKLYAIDEELVIDQNCKPKDGRCRASRLEVSAYDADGEVFATGAILTRLRPVD